MKPFFKSKKNENQKRLKRRNATSNMGPSEVNSCLLPNKGDTLYDNEVKSDVIFLVGKEPEVWRIPGHRHFLSEANPVFRALFEGPLATPDKTIVIEDVEGRAFDFLLRFVYGNDIEFQSSSTALSTLYAAHKYICPGLVQLCVQYLDRILDAANVLEIYYHARIYSPQVPTKNEYLPSAPFEDTLSTSSHGLLVSPNLNNNNNEAKTPVHCEQTCVGESSLFFWPQALHHNCLQLIDENAEKVLKQETIEDLDAGSLKAIVGRETLKLKSEFIVFSALDRWANRECKRRKLGLNSQNRRLVLGDLIFEIRFPFMTTHEFLLGPIQSSLFDQTELKMISALVSELENLPEVPLEWQPHIAKIRTKRKHAEVDTIALSKRSQFVDLDKHFKDLNSSNSIFRRSKSKKKCTKEKNSSKAFRSMSVDSGRSDKKCSSCFAEYVLDILSCIFD